MHLSHAQRAAGDCSPVKLTPGRGLAATPQAKIYQISGFENTKMYFRSCSHQILAWERGIANGIAGGGIAGGGVCILQT